MRKNDVAFATSHFERSPLKLVSPEKTLSKLSRRETSQSDSGPCVASADAGSFPYHSAALSKSS